MLKCAYLLYLSFSLGGFGRLFLLVNHSSSTSALASRGQNCPWQGFLGCHDHYCLFYMWLWTLAWASGPIRKMDVYHWLYDLIIAPQNLAFRLLGRKEGFWYPRPTLFIVNPFYPNSEMPFYLLKARSWRFGVQSAPSLNSDGIFVPHVQRHDANLMMGNFLGLRARIFPLVTSVPL